MGKREGIDPLWIAINRMLSPALTDAFALGITGSAIRRANTPLLHSDLLHGLFPGLAMCGIEATLTPLPFSTEDFQAMLQSRGGICLLAFSGDISQTPFAAPADPPNAASSNGAAALDIQERDPAVTESVFVTPVAKTSGKLKKTEKLTFSEMDGTTATLEAGDAAALCGRFSHALLLQKGARRPVKALALDHAIRVWAQFTCACPSRTLSIGATDAPLRTLASEFWQEMAGSGRSARSNRLRRLADLLAHPTEKRDLDAAFRSLYEMACESLLLPPYLENALLAPGTAVLSDAERRELIYLARAGTRDVKIFALHRLTFERECADALATLKQLRYDPDAWVRGAAQLSL